MLKEREEAIQHLRAERETQPGEIQKLQVGICYTLQEVETYPTGRNRSSKDTHGKSENTIAKSENTIAKSENTIAKSENTIAKSENTIAKSENTIAKLISLKEGSEQSKR